MWRGKKQSPIIKLGAGENGQSHKATKTGATAFERERRRGWWRLIFHFFPAFVHLVCSYTPPCIVFHPPRGGTQCCRSGMFSPPVV